MGLDMYLSRKLYVSQYDFGDPKATDLKIEGKGFESVTPSKVKYIIESAGYWRKANAIHQWFVDNCADGTDDCKPVYVSHEQLRKLLGVVDKVLESIKLKPAKITNGYTFKGNQRIPILEDGEIVTDTSVAEELLPTTSGFFFGSTDYDQYYVEDLKETKKILEEALDPKYDTWEYEYRASW